MRVQVGGSVQMPPFVLVLASWLLAWLLVSPRLYGEGRPGVGAGIRRGGLPIGYPLLIVRHRPLAWRALVGLLVLVAGIFPLASAASADPISDKKAQVQLPDEYVAHVMVFRTFDRVSYGLIMDGVRPVGLYDRARAAD